MKFTQFTLLFTFGLAAAHAMTNDLADDQSTLQAVGDISPETGMRSEVKKPTFLG
jgi:hypothetical protein